MRGYLNRQLLVPPRRRAKGLHLAERPKLYLSIQYFRALAALLVVFYHSRLPIGDFFDPFETFKYAAIAVDIFFLISGFVMYTSARGDRPAEFLRRRLIRIVPIYWLMTILYLLFTIVLFGTEYTLRRVVLSLLFIPHASVAGGSLGFPVLDVGWTLNAEMFFYALFWLGLCIRRPVLVPALGISLVVVFGLLTQSLGPISAFYSQTVMLDFVIGLLIGGALEKGYLRALWPLAPLGLACAVIMAAVDPALTTHPFLHFAVPAIMVVIGALAIEQRGALPQSGFAKRVGDASYSLYLTHVFLVQILFHIFSRLPLRGWPQYGSFVVTLFACAIFGAFLCYRRVEWPLTRFLNEKTRGWSASASGRATKPEPIPPGERAVVES